MFRIDSTIEGHQKKRTEDHFLARISLGSTHAGELDAAVTALGSSTLLLDVEVTELAARSLDDADLVGPRVVPVEQKPINIVLQGQTRN